MKFSLIALAMLLTACAVSPVLEGRVLYNGAPAPGAEVSLLDRLGNTVSRSVTDMEGVYKFKDLAPGAYRVTAGKQGAVALEAIGGPLQVNLSRGEKGWIGIKIAPVEKAEYVQLREGENGVGSATGVVLYDEKPLEGSIVSLYIDRAEGLRGKGFKTSMPTGEDGVYFLDSIPEGKYFIVARKRAGGGMAGPVNPGDYYGEGGGGIEIRSGTDTKLRIHVARKEKARTSRSEDQPPGGASLTGFVVGQDGKGIKGLYVFAYADRTIGHGMPTFMSESTKEDGSFVLNLGSGGLYYLGARSNFGVSPKPGELFGLFDGAPDHALKIGKGQHMGPVTIRVAKVLPQ